MTVINRIRSIVAANINHLLEKAEDPEKMIKQLIREMDAGIVRLRMEVAKAIAAEKRIGRRVDETTAALARWEGKSRKAVASGNEEQARQAIAGRLDAEQALIELRTQHEKAVTASELMKGELRQLEDRIQEARRRRDVLVARKRRAEAQKAMLDSSAAFSRASRQADSVLTHHNSDLGTLESLEDRVEDLEDEAEARRVVLETARPDARDEAEDRANAVEAELERLKKEVKEGQ